jgi:hypothetical protein
VVEPRAGIRRGVGRYVMGLNLSTAQIAHALDRHADDVYHRTMSRHTAPKSPLA